MRTTKGAVLLPCPACGAEAHWTIGFWQYGMLFPVIVECGSEDCEGICRAVGPTLEIAALGWNAEVATILPSLVN